MKKLLTLLAFALVTFTVYAQSTQKGDVNGDGDISVTDVAKIVNYILGVNDDDFIAANADINGDGEIDINDVMATVSIILKGDNSPQVYLTCPDDHHPHMIDLGLPSGTKWACCNVGADKPEAYGGYYAWGETEDKSIYNDVTYQYATGIDDDGDGWYDDYHSDTGFSGVWQSLGDDIAGSQYDVAHVIWDGSWVMPSLKQIKELKENCTYVYTTLNSVGGYLFNGPTGGKIFMPSAGYRKGDGLIYTGSYGDYWSSTYIPSSSGSAYCLYFNTDEVGWNNFYRGNGRSVRPVSVANTHRTLAVSMSSVVVFVDETKFVEITSGNGSYIVNCFASNVATASLSGNTITITGITPGTAVVTVTDTRSGQTATIQVMVQEAGDIPQAYHTCPDNHHPHLIDFGLPSGTLWACCNVGANKPEGYGGYYAWGETEEKDCYNDETYPWFVRNNEWTYYYISLGDDIAGTEYDVAHVKWGGKWQMPSQEDLLELKNYATFTHDRLNGVYGGRLRSSNGAHIFLPAAGSRGDYNLHDVGEYGNYWTSTQFPPVYQTLYVFNCLCYAYHYQFGTEINGYGDKTDYYQGPRDSYGGSRPTGFSVRPVYKP